MTDTRTPAAEELFALRSVRDSHVIFRVGLTDLSLSFYEKVGESAVPVPHERAARLNRMFFSDENLIEAGHKIHSTSTISFRYRTVMLTPAGQAVLRAAGA
jgi:hypothetical protein